MILPPSAPSDFVPWRHELREKCGVFGIVGDDLAGAIAIHGVHALQHRGQEGCGIASFDGKRFHTERHMGLVGDTLMRPGVADRLKGRAAIGHTRYSTQGEPTIRNNHPLYADLGVGGVAIAHNGNITNARALRARLTARGAIFQSTTDTEVILHLMAQAVRATMIDRFIEALSALEGAYALVALTAGGVLAARDPVGIRPLVLGELEGAPVVCSETCALDLVGAKFVRDVLPGEVLVLSERGVESQKPFAPKPPRPCVFEYIYFARPDSIVNGRSVYDVRRRFGQRLAEEHPVPADVIVPVPDSGVPAAIGYAETAQAPFQMGIIRSHYVGRTFIEPTASGRKLSVRRKHNANRSQLAGKRVVLVDDSIVRGTTSAQIVQLVRDAGAAEVHFRVASPPIQWPDFYGIDMPNREDLIAAKHTPKKIAKKLEVDSLGFLSIEGMYWALGENERKTDAPAFADHCFTGEYPTALTDLGNDEAAKDVQLSFLE